MTTCPLPGLLGSNLGFGSQALICTHGCLMGCNTLVSLWQKRQLSPRQTKRQECNVQRPWARGQGGLELKNPSPMVASGCMVQEHGPF